MPNQPSGSAHLRFWNLYDTHARKWGEYYMMRHLWRIRAMYDYEDVKQDVLFVWWRTCNKYPDLPADELLKIFKAGVIGRMHNRARECFPNEHAFAEERGKIVLNVEELQEILPPTGNGLDRCIEKSHEKCYAERGEEGCLNLLSNVFENLPDELAELLKLLVQDMFGRRCINRGRKGRKHPVKIRQRNARIAKRANASLEALEEALGFNASERK